MKKKFLSLFFAICLIVPCVFALTGCGTSAVVGTYALDKVTMTTPAVEGVSEETTVSLTYAEYLENKDKPSNEQSEAYKALYFQFEQGGSMVLNSDNTIKVESSMGNQSVSFTGTWKEDGKEVSITLSVMGMETTQKYTFENDTLTSSTTQEGATITMTFKKSA